jgi:hypothetical protein
MPPAPIWPDLYPVIWIIHPPFQEEGRTLHPVDNERAPRVQGGGDGLSSSMGSYCLDETNAKNLLKNKALLDGYRRDVELIWEK